MNHTQLMLANDGLADTYSRTLKMWPERTTWLPHISSEEGSLSQGPQGTVPEPQVGQAHPNMYAH